MTDDLPEQLSLPLSDDVSMEFRLLPAGEFRMGSRGYDAYEEPIHRVVITRPFYMGIYPVTQRQFAVWTQAAGIDHRNRFDGHPEHPAESMDWLQSRDFCQWLNERCGTAIPPEFVVGLPSEAQWEYACRLMKRDGRPVAVDTEYYTGDGEAALSQAGWYGEEWDKGCTHPVGSTEKRPTDFGLHDMHGNVREWCQDWWANHAYKLRIDAGADPMFMESDMGVPENEAKRVFRGGSRYDYAWNCRAAYRYGWSPGYRDSFQGFRVCLFLGPVHSRQSNIVVTSEPESIEVARRQAAAKSEDSGGEVAEVDLADETLTKHSDGTKFEI